MCIFTGFCLESGISLSLSLFVCHLVLRMGIWYFFQVSIEFCHLIFVASVTNHSWFRTFFFLLPSCICCTGLDVMLPFVLTLVDGTWTHFTKTLGIKNLMIHIKESNLASPVRNTKIPKKRS